MVKCKIVSDIIILKVDVGKISDVKYFEVDTGFHKFVLKNKTQGAEKLGFYSGYSFEFHEDASVLQQQLAKNPIKLTLSNDECKLAEGESYWPSYIYDSINGSPQQAMHVVKCKLNSEKLMFDVIELIIRMKVTPLKSIDINQLHKISVTNRNKRHPNRTDRKPQIQIFQELAKDYQITEEKKNSIPWNHTELKSKLQQKIKSVAKEPRIKKKTRRLLGGCELETKKYDSPKLLNDSCNECSECKLTRLKGGQSCANHTSRHDKWKPHTFQCAASKTHQRDSRNCAKISCTSNIKDNSKNVTFNSWELNNNPEHTNKVHLAKVMNEMYEIFHLNQLRQGKHHENVVYSKHEHLKDLKRQQFDDHQRKHRHLQRIYQLMKHPLLQNCMSHIGQRQTQTLRGPA